MQGALHHVGGLSGIYYNVAEEQTAESNSKFETTRRAEPNQDEYDEDF